jgi:hypothetical protein
LDEWQRQIREKEDAKKRRKQREIEEDLKIDYSYNPYGRAGAGAPNRQSVERSSMP